MVQRRKYKSLAKAALALLSNPVKNGGITEASRVCIFVRTSAPNYSDQRKAGDVCEESDADNQTDAGVTSILQGRLNRE